MASLKGKQNPAYKHGFATRGKRPTLYYKWQRMIARCHHPSQKDYARYGAKGITVCDRWRFGEDGISGFECWLLDMGAPPFKKAQIDRLDNALGYTPSNCRWASTIEQANNRTTNRWVTARGQTHTVAQWARIVGIERHTILYRLNQGATPEEALFKRPDRGAKLSTTRRK
jgi:hypothetical protein